MTRRRGIIAALAGLLPAIGAFGQKEYEFQVQESKSNSLFTLGDLSQRNPIMVSFHSRDGGDVFSAGWDLEKGEMVVKADRREARITAKEIMDALEGK